MSWSEVFKINNNMKRALNEQLRDLKFQEMTIITSTTTYRPNKTGLYKVICVGAGGDGKSHLSTSYPYSASGGGGGVAVKTLRLHSNTNYNVTVTKVASFVYDSNIILTANPGLIAEDSSTVGTGGSAYGGDNNYNGSDGQIHNDIMVSPIPGGVGVCIQGLYNTPIHMSCPLQINTASSNNQVNSAITYVTLCYGDSVLGYGGGGTAIVSNLVKHSTSYPNIEAHLTGKPACVIIVPLEMEE